ncbi:pilus assembly protein TadG-related protein [Alloalcanivorax xenomutans]|uniref:pilus assembly protein TadG-related protein n=1 Tax=Alloalcanivorax xenomutans TaxID=1094342 RepID=UPI003BAC1FC8
MNKGSVLHRRQTGTALLWVVSLSFIFMMTAFVADVSRLYFDKRQLQTAANTVASKLVDDGQTCFGAELSEDAIDLASRAKGILDENFSGEDFSVDVAKVVSVDGESGVYEVADVVQDARESNGVAVTISKPAPGLVSFVLDENIKAHSVARKDVTATISTTNSTLVAGQDNTVLGAILGNILGIGPIDATDLASLAGTTATVGDLLVGLGVNDVADLVSPLLSAKDLADALKEVGGLSGPAISILDSVAGSAGISTVPLTDVLAIVEGASVPESSEFPLYDTIIALVLKVGELAFTIPPTTIDIPGLPGEEVTLDLVVNQAPSVLLGTARWDPSEEDWEAKAYGADIELNLTLDVSLGLLGVLNLGSIKVPLSVSTGSSELALIAASCAKGSSQRVAFLVDASVSGVSLSGDINTEIAGGLLKVEAAVGADVLSSNDDKEPLLFEADLLGDGVPRTPEYGYRISKKLPTAGDISLSLKEINVELLGISIIPGIIDLVKGIVNNTLSPVLSALASNLLVPLLSGLGVELGTVTASLDDARQGSMTLIECGEPLCADL